MLDLFRDGPGDTPNAAVAQVGADEHRSGVPEPALYRVDLGEAEFRQRKLLEGALGRCARQLHRLDSPGYPSYILCPPPYCSGAAGV
jgi:hypothetical protein